jgi:hypothetical protein
MEIRTSIRNVFDAVIMLLNTKKHSLWLWLCIVHIFATLHVFVD